MGLMELAVKLLAAIGAVAGAVAAYLAWRKSKLEATRATLERGASKDRTGTVTIRAGRDSTYIANSFNNGERRDGN